MLPFILKMAWRETRASWRHFVYFFACIALGVGALVGIGVFSAQVERTVTQEARALMGGDLEIRLSRPLRESGGSTLGSLRSRGIAETHVSELIAMASTAESSKASGNERPLRPTQIVELKAVDAAYPLYGSVKSEPYGPLANLLRTEGPCRSVLPRSNGSEPTAPVCYGAVVQDALLIKMGLSVGDEMKIGRAFFRITGILRHEPDRVASAFSLGPRVIVSREGLDTANLIQPGSRVRERYLLRLPATVPPYPLLRELQAALEGDAPRISTYREAQPQLRRFLDQLSRYLGLVGLTALFIGGIGVVGTIHAFMKEKIRTIAILKTLGADSTPILTTYLFQAVFLALCGSLVGIALGLSLQAAMPSLLATVIPADLLQLAAARGSIPLHPLVKGLALGVGTTLLFALWPLLTIRRIRPALVFRTEILPSSTETGSSFRHRVFGDRTRWATAMLISLGLISLSIWQSRSVTVGLLFIGALVAAALLLQAAARLLIALLVRVRNPRSVAIRHALANLHRPGGHAAGIMMAVGIGVMVTTTISLVERSLVGQIGESRPVDAPTFFFIDIQPDQREDFQRLIQDRLHGVRAETTPLVRSRLHAVNGRIIRNMEEQEQDHGEGRRGERGKSWYFTREYVLTFLDRLPKNNTIVKGEWWDHGVKPDTLLVSVEEDAANNLGLGLGSTVEFEIQGATLEATVSSIRKVEWSNLSTNFYMILSPGSLDGAPFTYVATVRVRPDQEIPLQQAVVTSFPNVTAINIGEVMNTFIGVLERLSFAIRTVALFCILTGATVMAASLATTRYRRLYESVILKALGGTRNLIAVAFAVEYALIGAVGGFIGLVLAELLSWGVLHFVLDLPWSPHPAILVTGMLSTVLLTVLVGFLSTFRILGQRPLAILRHE